MPPTQRSRALDREQRVAVRRGHRPAHRVRVEVGVRGPDERARVVVVQRREQDPCAEHARADQVLLGRVERLGRDRATGDQQQRRQIVQSPAEMGEQRERGPIRQVGVLEHEQQRRVRRRGGHRGHRRLIQPHAIELLGWATTGGVAEPQARDEPREVGKPARVLGELGAPSVEQRVQELGPRRQRRRRLELDARAQRHARAVADRVRGQFRRQARLSDARLTVEHDHTARPRPRRGPLADERRQLAAAADERKRPGQGDERGSRAGAKLVGRQGRRRLQRRVGPQRRGKLARVPARRHPQLAPQPFAEALVRRQRGAAIPGGDERRHQAADGTLAQRIQPRSPARPFDRHRRFGRVAGACRERGAEPVAALVTRRERPLVLEPAQQLTTLGQLGRRRDVTPVQRRVELARVHLRTVDECQPVAAGEDRVARRAEVASQDPQRVAQALARALVQDIGPEAAGELAARLRPRVQREIRQQRARRRGARRGQGRSVELERQRAEQPNSQHGKRERIASAAP